jgi:hypothetical protein
MLEKMRVDAARWEEARGPDEHENVHVYQNLSV